MASESHKEAEMRRRGRIHPFYDPRTWLYLIGLVIAAAITLVLILL